MSVLRAGIVVVALASALGIAQAQAGGEQKAKAYEPRKMVLSPQPVTKDEANQIFNKVDQAIVKVMPALKTSGTHLVGAQPVTREEIVSQFDRIFQMAKPEFKFTPKRVAYDPAILTIKDKK